MKAINPLGSLLSLPLPLPLHPRLVSETAHDFGRQIVNEVVVLVDGILQSLLARLLEVVSCDGEHTRRERERGRHRHTHTHNRYTHVDGQTHTHLLNVIGCGDERAQSFAALGHPRQLLGPLVTTGGVWGRGRWGSHWSGWCLEGLFERGFRRHWKEIKREQSERGGEIDRRRSCLSHSHSHSPPTPNPLTLTTHTHTPVDRSPSHCSNKRKI